MNMYIKSKTYLYIVWVIKSVKTLSINLSFNFLYIVVWDNHQPKMPERRRSYLLHLNSSKDTKSRSFEFNYFYLDVCMIPKCLYSNIYTYSTSEEANFFFFVCIG